MAISAEIRCIHLVSLFLMKLFMLGLHLDICVCLCSVTNLESRGEHSTVQGFLHLQFCLLKRILSYLCIFCITSAVGYNHFWWIVLLKILSLVNFSSLQNFKSYFITLWKKFSNIFRGCIFTRFLMLYSGSQFTII